MRARRLLAVASILVACGVSPGSPVVGLVTAVDGDLTTVRSFTVVNGNDSYLFVPAEDGDFAFPLPHLRDHLRSGQPVRVEYLPEGDTLVAIAVEDG